MKNDVPALWEILYQADYGDGDGGLSLADTCFYVLAKRHDEALRKARPLLEKCGRDYHRNIRVVANLVTLENLLPARDSENDGRLGWICSSRLAEVKLSLGEDNQKFRLGVCILPIE